MVRLVTQVVIACLLCFPGHASAQAVAALTPPMGWNSWNHYRCSIDEALIRRTADALVASGLRDAGYVYVNLDDCWQGARDADGRIQPDPVRFPSGLKALGDYLHARQLKFGIYSDTGARTCAGRPGSQGHEYVDARQYAAWGVDYVKYDWCNTGTGENQRNPREGYALMRDAIAASGRPMLLSICEWGENKPWLWGKGVGQMWRVAGDIAHCWDCVLSHGNWQSYGVMRIVDRNEPLRAYAGPGHWNDPDMLEVGNLPTSAEDRSHFALWAMMAAPLIIGTHVDNMKPEVAAILGNRRIIAVDQDKRGIQGFRWLAESGHEIWARPLEGGDWAIAIVNRGDDAAKIRLDWASHGLEDAANGLFVDFTQSRFAIVDLWSGKPAGTTRDALAVALAPHDTAMFRLTPIAGAR